MMRSYQLEKVRIQDLPERRIRYKSKGTKKYCPKLKGDHIFMLVPKFFHNGNFGWWYEVCQACRRHGTYHWGSRWSWLN